MIRAINIWTYISKLTSLDVSAQKNVLYYWLKLCTLHPRVSQVEGAEYHFHKNLSMAGSPREPSRIVHGYPIKIIQ